MSSWPCAAFITRDRPRNAQKQRTSIVTCRAALEGFRMAWCKACAKERKCELQLPLAEWPAAWESLVDGIVPDPKATQIEVKRQLVPIAVDLLRKFELRSTEADTRATLWRWAHVFWSEWLKSCFVDGVDAFVSEQPGCSKVSLSAIWLQLSEQPPIHLPAAAKTYALKKEKEKEIIDEGDFSKRCAAWRLAVTAGGHHAPPAVVVEVVLRSVGRTLYASCLDPPKAELFRAAALEVCKELGGAKDRAQDVVRSFAPKLALLAADHPNGLTEPEFWSAFGDALHANIARSTAPTGRTKRKRKETDDATDVETDAESLSAEEAQKPDTELLAGEVYRRPLKPNENLTPTRMARFLPTLVELQDSCAKRRRMLQVEMTEASQAFTDLRKRVIYAEALVIGTARWLMANQGCGGELVLREPMAEAKELLSFYRDLCNDLAILFPVHIPQRMSLLEVLAIHRK